MAYQVLATKLYAPPIQPDLVPRLDLVQRIENGYQAGRHMTLVSAPAGFGKTTIIREWLTAEKSRKSFGWVQLDEGDNDPVRFLVYLVSALQQVNAKTGQSVLVTLQTSQTPDLMDLIDILINEISNQAGSFLIVLDDYHLIKKAEVHGLMQSFLRLQPANLHWVILTREDPPLPLPRMRVQGQITEVRERDLRFTLSEAQDFLLKTMGLKLSPEDVARLEERTEGWAAGMQLAALALEEFPTEAERQAFIEAFAGSNRLIVDYLISEVLQLQSETTRQFLLRTSLLDRFCAELCDSVVFGNREVGTSQIILNTLEQGNMFVVPLDNQRHWYRYHHLFSEMLLHSLQRTSPEEIPSLHYRASEWFEAKGLIPEAARHGLASKDWKFVNVFLDHHALPMLFQGHVNLVVEWCRDIPRAYLEKAPDICIYYAWALVLTFRQDYMGSVEEKLQIAERAITRPDFPAFADVGQNQARVPYRDWVIGHMCVIRSQILLGNFNTFIDPEQLIALSLKGLDLLPEVEFTFRSTCMINLALAQLMQNDPMGAQKELEKSLPFQNAAGNFLGAVTNVFYQARLAFYTGHQAVAESLCQQWKVRFAEMAGISTADDQVLFTIPAVRGLDVVRAIILLERNQVEDARQLLVRTVDIPGWASWMELHGFIELARLYHSRGDHEAAQEVLERMIRQGPQHEACAEALRVWFDIRNSLNDLPMRSKAETWAESHAPDPHTPLALGIGPYHCDTEYLCNLVWARVQTVLSQPQLALTFIDPALEIARKNGLFFRIIELSLAKAVALDQLGTSSTALDELGKALELGEKVGYAHVFNDEPEVDRLIHRAAEHKIHTQYARQLLASFNRPATRETSPVFDLKQKKGSPGWVDPLTDREVEVLRLLAGSLTPAEVASQLYLSPYTLKAHTQNIYTKLGVHSRIEAINKARALGIL
jgi:LuxR family transcriptional regulator, maltose regulon positive regulatory protein